MNGFWGDGGESFDSLMEAGKLIQNSHLAHVDEHLCVIKDEAKKDDNVVREHQSIKDLFTSEVSANKVK